MSVQRTLVVNLIVFFRAAVNLVEAETVDIGVTGGSRPARSNPVNMPHATTKPLVPVVIDGSGSELEMKKYF